MHEYTLTGSRISHGEVNVADKFCHASVSLRTAASIHIAKWSPDGEYFATVGKVCHSLDAVNIKTGKRALWSKCIFCIHLLDAFLHRMTVYSRCGIPPRVGAPQWWSRTSPIKSLLLFTSPSSTWPTLAQSLACPGGRPVNTCLSKKAAATLMVLLLSKWFKN